MSSEANYATWLDGSDAPQPKASPPNLYTKLKSQLNDAVLTIEALDKASLAMLQHDVEYHKTLQRLLAPLTAAPLSELVEETMKSGLEAISSKMSALIRSATPSHDKTRRAQSNQLAGSGSSPIGIPTEIGVVDRDALYITTGEDSDSSESQPSSPASIELESRRFGVLPGSHRRRLVETLVRRVQVRSSEALQQVIDQSGGGLLVIWLHLRSGSWKEGLGLQRLLKKLNQRADRDRGSGQHQNSMYESSKFVPGRRDAHESLRFLGPRHSTLRQDFSSNSASVFIDAWMTKDGSAIVFFAHSTEKWDVIYGTIKDLAPIVTGSSVLTRPDDRTHPSFNFL